MELLIYSSINDGAGGRLLNVMRMLLPEKKFELCRSIEEFSQRLRQPIFNPTIAVILALSREELQAIISIRHLLEDTKIILIVPDTNPDTMKKGHTLRPRYLTNCESDYVDVAAVLKRMLSHHGNKKI